MQSSNQTASIIRSSTMDLLTVPCTDTSFGLRRFSVAGPRIWNGLPHELRQCNTLPCFKSHLEDTLLLPSHGQLAPHSQVVPPIAFLWWSLRVLNKFVTDTELTNIGLFTLHYIKYKFITRPTCQFTSEYGTPGQMPFLLPSQQHQDH